MANMLSQLGDMYKLQKEAKQMQKKMKQVEVSGLSKNEEVEIVMDGTQSILEIGIDDNLLNPESKQKLIRALKEASSSAQKKLQKKMMEDFDISNLKDMLGK